MKISILTLFPNMIKGFFDESIIKRAQEQNLVEVELVNLRDFAIDTYGTVDDKPYGGGAGMILRADVIDAALNKLKIKNSNEKKVILTSPRGKIYNQIMAEEYSKLDQLIIISGHYEGMDERVNDLVDEEVSLGDFVMTGGEIAASAIADSVVRLIPGVLKKENASKEESFFSVGVDELIAVVGEHELLMSLKDKKIQKIRLLEYPHYTRPEEFQGKKVPEVLLSGNHAQIEKWRNKMAFEETLKRRPDLLIG